MARHHAELPTPAALRRLTTVPGSRGERYVDPRTGRTYSRYSVRVARTGLSPETQAGVRRLGLPVSESSAKRLRAMLARYRSAVRAETGRGVDARTILRRPVKGETVRTQALRDDFFDAARQLAHSRDAAGRRLISRRRMDELLQRLGFLPPDLPPRWREMDTPRLAPIFDAWRVARGMPAR